MALPRPLMLLLVAPVVARAAAAWAQTSEPALHGEGPLPGQRDITDMSLQELLASEITTASRVVERLIEAPATVYVITKNDIRQRGYATLADVLRDVPGMEVVEQYYSEQGTLVPVRGVVGNNKIVLLVNGVRVNPPGGEELMIRDDVSVRFAEQIEIIYGPGSTLYGQDAISAVINLKTQRPGEARAELLGAYGSYDAREGFASVATRFRQHTDVPLSVTAFVSARSSDLANFRTQYQDWWQKYQDYLTPLDRAGDPVRGNTGYNLFARVESRTASLQAWFRDSTRSSAEGSGEGGPNPVLFFVPESKWRDRSFVIEGQHALRLADSVTLRSSLVFNRYQVDPQSRYVFPDGAGGLFLDDYKYAVGTGVTLEEKVDWELGDSTHFIFGAVGSSYNVVPKTTVPGGADPNGGIVSQAGTLTYYTRPGDEMSRVDIPRTVDLHYEQYGAYAEGSHRFTESLRAIAGVRVDVNTRYDAVPVSPRAAVVYNPLQGRLALKYVFSMAYVAPAPYFAYNVFDNGHQISSGNPKLKPERALSNEVNVTWQDQSLLASASAYFNHQSDLLITSQSEAVETVIMPEVFVDPLGMGPPRRLTHSINLGTSNALGADLFARYSFSRFSFWGSYSYVDFNRTIGEARSGLAQISRHNVRAGLTVGLPGGLSLTPSLVFRSTPENLTATYEDVGVSLSNPYEINLTALYAPYEALDVFATIRNLTHRHYALRGVSGPALQEPFTAVGGLRLRH